MRLTLAGGASLGAAEARVLGCLMEKQRTTPDAYPLSLNALRLACNQSTNRDPVVDYDEGVVREALHRLERSGIVRLASGAGSRAPKYRHLLADRLTLGRAQEAVLCVLLLRGAQTPGELKQRSERLHGFAELSDVHDTLRGLIEEGLVERLERRPGQKEERFRELLQGREDGGEGMAPGSADVDADPPAAAAAGGSPVVPPQDEWPGGRAQGAAEASLVERVARLEREVAELRGMLAGPGVPAGPASGGTGGAVSPDRAPQPVAGGEGL